MDTREIPPVEMVHREIAVWNPEKREFLRGRRIDFIVPQDPVEIVWTNTGENTDVTPDHDTELSVLYATRMAVQIDSTHASNSSTDFDVNVESTIDGAHWDTVPYAERNIGNDEIKTFLVEVGASKIRLRGDNNASGTTGYITARVLVVK